MGQVLNSTLALVGILLSARYCGPSIFGLFSAIVIAATILIILLDFGACNWASRQLLIGSITPNNYFKIMRSKALLAFFLALPFSGILMIKTQSAWATLLGLLFPVGGTVALYFQSYLLLLPKNHFKLIKLQVSERLFWLCVIPLSYFQVEREAIFVIPLILGQISNLMLGPTLAKTSWKEIFSNHYLRQRQIFKNSSYFGGNSILTNISIADTLLVTLLIGGNAATGYVLAQRFRNPLTLGFHAFFARVRPSVATRNLQNIYLTLKKESYLIFLNCIGVFLFAFIFANYTSEIFGPEYRGIEPTLILCFASALLSGANHNLLGIMDVMLIEKWKLSFLLTAIPLQLISISTGAMTHGAIGAAVLLLVSSLFITFFATIKVVKIFKEISDSSF
jgi:O-antigen/teichoic acid export membrane protein